MSSMFNNATSYNQALNKQKVANVTTTDDMFLEAPSYYYPLIEWTLGNKDNNLSPYSMDCFNILLCSWYSQRGLDIESYFETV